MKKTTKEDIKNNTDLWAQENQNIQLCDIVEKISCLLFSVFVKELSASDNSSSYSLVFLNIIQASATYPK